MKSIPNEPAVLSALSSNITESGFYFFPGAGLEAERLPKEQQEAAMQKWDADYRTLPHGILIVKQPTGAAVPFAKLLLIELGTNVLGGLIAAWLLSLAAPSLPSLIARIVFVAVLGFFATVNIDASYWNWYDFPTNYLVSSIIDSPLAGRSPESSLDSSSGPGRSRKSPFCPSPLKTQVSPLDRGRQRGRVLKNAAS